MLYIFHTWQLLCVNIKYILTHTWQLLPFPWGNFFVPPNCAYYMGFMKGINVSNVVAFDQLLPLYGEKSLKFFPGKLQLVMYLTRENLYTVH
jgi:hypothetical protein